MVDFKYKVTDIAKDFGISTKKVIETFAELTGETLFHRWLLDAIG